MPEKASLQGWEPTIGDGISLAQVVDFAFTYRGDVTLDMVDGTAIEGYLFNHQGNKATNAMPIAEVIQTETGERLQLPYHQIESIRFTGRDMAAGQSLEAWQRRRSANAGSAKA